MKYLLPCFLLLIFACTSNDFSDTEMSFETDKKNYKIGDSFEISIVISPLKKEKEIQFFNDFRNLNIYFSVKDQENAISLLLKQKMIEKPNRNDIINKYIITKEQPFKKTFVGKIYEKNDKIYFKIPDLKIREKFDKSLLLKIPIVTIQGSCRSVSEASSLDFTPKDIKIDFE